MSAPAAAPPEVADALGAADAALSEVPSAYAMETPEDETMAEASFGRELASLEEDANAVATRPPTLAEAAEWVKDRLHYLAYLQLRLPEPPPPPGIYETSPASQTPQTPSWGGWFGGLGHRTSRASGPAKTNADPTERRREYHHLLERWRQECNAHERGVKAEGGHIALPETLRTLKTRFGLSEFEARLVLLCIAAEIEPSVSPLCGAALQRIEESDALASFAFPTVTIAKACFPNHLLGAAAALLPHRPLECLGLLTVNEATNSPLTLWGLSCSARLSDFLRGGKGRNDLFARYCRPVPPIASKDALLESENAALSKVINALKQACQIAEERKVRQAEPGESLPKATNAAVALVGPSAAGQQRIAVRAAEALIPTDAHSDGKRAFRLLLADFPAHEEDREILLVALERELLLAPFLLVLDAHSGELPPAFFLRRLLDLPGKILLLAPDAVPDAPIAEVVRLQPPTAQEQKGVWLDALKENARGYAPELARQFRLSADDIRAIAAKLPNLPTGRPLKEKLWDACKEKTRPRMEGLAERIEPKADWNSLVLPTQERELLEQIAAQARARYAVYDEMHYAERKSRGLGISALFHGESGTGKTLAAEVVAHELLLDLYRIDLSAVVDKYIGETEKNLRRLFDAAEEGGAVLFFDEADALFGKRTEVKDSHDRNANIEINYLLQRMESYTGLAILATNRKNDLDKAFIRRLRFIVPFPLPEAEQRAAIWAVSLPSDVRDENPGEWPVGTPIAWEDQKDKTGKITATGAFTRLSRLNVTGGVIQNIALGAMFRAGARDKASPNGKPRKVNIYDIGESAREEFRKLERSLPETDLPPKRPFGQGTGDREQGTAADKPLDAGVDI